MPLRFPETEYPDALVGQTPWSARVPLDPLLCNEISLIESQRADEGVGCGPGGPPHKLSELSAFGTTKWHWDGILRAGCQQLSTRAVCADWQSSRRSSTVINLPHYGPL
jgi:hypothetical protein